MAGGPGKLYGTTKPDGDHVWNGSRITAWWDALSPRWVIGREALIYRTYRYKKMTRNKEDDDV